MSWCVDLNRPDNPVWTGTDSLFDMRRSERVWAYGLAMLAFVVGTPASYIGLAVSPFIIPYAIKIGAYDSAFFLALMAYCCFQIVRPSNRLRLNEIPSPGLFICRDWSLQVIDGQLVYRAGPFSNEMDPNEVSRDGSSWRVPLNAVARVESGLTAEWHGVRHYPILEWKLGALKTVPAAEYQTFLFLNDGSRRVFHTVNADREGSITLAQSIRAWIEDRRSKTSLAQRSDGEGYGL